jgi:hypothetical protein
MVAGNISGESSSPWHAGNISWTEEESGQIYDITSAGRWMWSKSGKLGGYACSRCGIIEVRVDPKELNPHT